MKSWRPPKDWRPTGTLLIWVYAGSFLVCMAMAFIGQFFGLAGEGITAYPPVKWLSWVMLVFIGVVVAVLLSLLVGISMNREYPSPMPHPFVTLEFWVSALGCILLAIVLSATLYTLVPQQEINNSVSENTRVVIGIVIAAVGVSVRYVNAIRPYTVEGLSFGSGAVFIVILCSVLS